MNEIPRIHQARDASEYSPWRPPIESPIPAQIVKRKTVFTLAAGNRGFERCRELAELTGLNPEELVIFHPERVALHQLIASAVLQLQVSEIGTSYLRFGEKFREQIAFLQRHLLEPQIDDIRVRLEALNQRVGSELNKDIEALQRSKPEHREFLLISWVSASFETGGYEPTLETHQRIARAGALFRHFRRLLPLYPEKLNEPQLFEALRESCLPEICNDATARAAFEIINLQVLATSDPKGLPLLSRSPHPVITILLKGPPAVGKSSYRPTIRSYVTSRGIQWEDMRQVSPDIWRALLLDRQLLGADGAYFGQLTEDEISFVATRIMHLVRQEHDHQPHLLIDHFYISPLELAQVSVLSTRVDFVFMYCEPEMAVARAFSRGEKIGRYVSVETLLLNFHLALKSFRELVARSSHENVRFIILDNSVPEGQEPITIASINCHSREMKIFRPDRLAMLSVLEKLDSSATGPSELFPSGVPSASESFHPYDQKYRLRFIEKSTGVEYACFEKGRLVVRDAQLFAAHCSDSGSKEALSRLG